MSNYLPNHEGEVVVTLLGGSKIALEGPFKSITISTPEGVMEISFEYNPLIPVVPVPAVVPQVVPYKPESQPLFWTPWEESNDDSDDDYGDDDDYFSQEREGSRPPNQDGEFWCSICRAYHGPLDI
jgi:hypothetical protein